MNEEKQLDKGLAKILSKKCVNSNWIARWLANNNEEWCQCSFGECKVRVDISYNGHPPYTFILTEAEYRNLPEQ